ncbi:MAG: branched-chain amino acid ABC transporter permease [Clostridiales bacterium]|nr:branched-chain amino acid ABC transporter permease [Clostridiales bacterium]MCD7827314.1 branched-chain amino acid ABC transporter permease [Clostridiales bacterium]
MNIDINTIKTIAEVLTSISVIFGVIFACFRWYIKQNKQDEDIKAMKEENAMICYGLQACLDGLEQLGANHAVTAAKEKLEKHLNQSAHK